MGMQSSVMGGGGPRRRLASVNVRADSFMAPTAPVFGGIGMMGGSMSSLSSADTGGGSSAPTR